MKGKALSEPHSPLERLKAFLAEAKRVAPARVAEERIVSILAVRRAREAILGADLFSDPAWDILLHLCAAQLGRRPMSVLDLAADIPASQQTIARWVIALERKGLLSTENDEGGSLGMWVKLESKGLAALKQIADHAGSALSSI